MKGPSHKDYGGFHYQRRGRTRFTSDDSVSLRCRDCDKLTYRSKRELNRAARARCMACGGTLIETEAAQKAELGTKSERKKKDRHVEAEIAKIARSYKCWCCGRAHETRFHLAIHLNESSECFDEYIRDGKMVIVFGGQHGSKPHRVVPETMYVEYMARGTLRWAVKALCSGNGQETISEVKRFSTKKEADSFVEFPPQTTTNG